jgi:Ca-activated chloride channel family protein
MKKLLILLALVQLYRLSRAVDVNFKKAWLNRQGKQSYEQKKYPQATEKFNHNAVNNPEDGRLQYNLGDAYYQSGKLDEAYTAYQKSLSDKHFKGQSQAYQNMGNIHFKKEEYQQALDNYKKSIIAKPDNKNARYNYELAKKMLVQQQQQKQQKQDQKQDQQQQKQEQKKSPEQKQQDQKKQNADQILKALMENERNDMKKEQQKMPAPKRKNAKYW